VGIKTAILGIGNILLRDEGVGVHAVRALQERYTFPEDVELIDGGTMGLDLLPFIEDKDRLLIIDAVNFKDTPPGTVRIIEGKDIKAFLDTKLSVHQIGLPDMLFSASLKGTIPPEMCLVGIQPDTIEVGLQMSEKLNERFETLINAILDKLKSWGVEVNNVSGNTV
jgi:hydrogenase maturation protease